MTDHHTKRPYQRPQLQDLGTLQDLTRGGSDFPDGGDSSTGYASATPSS